MVVSRLLLLNVTKYINLTQGILIIFMWLKWWEKVFGNTGLQDWKIDKSKVRCN